MSERNGYEHGVPSWIAGAHPDPDQAAAFYTELFGWDAERRGEHLVCTLRGRDVAGFVRGDEPAWRTTRVGRERRRDRRARAAPRAAAWSAEPFDVAGVGRTADARRPRRRGLHRLRARPPPRRPGRQRARRVGDERALDPRHRGRQRLLPRRLRLGDRQLRARCHAVPPPRLRRRRAVAAGARATSSPSASRATRRGGTSTSGSTTSTPSPSKAAELGGSVLIAPPEDDADRPHAPSSPTRRARTFSVSRVVPA